LGPPGRFDRQRHSTGLYIPETALRWIAFPIRNPAVTATGIDNDLFTELHDGLLRAELPRPGFTPRGWREECGGTAGEGKIREHLPLDPIAN
jgi:hypothetical protein